MGGPYCKTCDYFVDVILGGKVIRRCSDPSKVIYGEHGEMKISPPECCETDGCSRHTEMGRGSESFSGWIGRGKALPGMAPLVIGPLTIEKKFPDKFVISNKINVGILGTHGIFGKAFTEALRKEGEKIKDAFCAFERCTFELKKFKPIESDYNPFLLRGSARKETPANYIHKKNKRAIYKKHRR